MDNLLRATLGNKGGGGHDRGCRHGISGGNSIIAGENDGARQSNRVQPQRLWRLGCGHPQKWHRSRLRVKQWLGEDWDEAISDELGKDLQGNLQVSYEAGEAQLASA